MIKAIAAISEKDYIIWNENNIPWNMPWDKDRFRELIKDQIVVMGRVTYESLKKYYPNYNWHPLAKKNIVLSKTLSSYNWMEVVSDFKVILQKYKDQIIRVIWWEKIYKIFLPYIDELYLTLVEWKYQGDAFFPYNYQDFLKEVAWEIWIDKWTIYKYYKKI